MKKNECIFKSQSHFSACYLVKIWRKCSDSAKAIIWPLSLAVVGSQLLQGMARVIFNFGLRNGKPYFGSQKWPPIGGENFGSETKIVYWLWLLLASCTSKRLRLKWLQFCSMFQLIFGFGNQILPLSSEFKIKITNSTLYTHTQKKRIH